MVARRVNSRGKLPASGQTLPSMTKDRTPMSECKFRGVPAVILAAGRSIRMGRIKALLPWPPHGRPCVIHVTEQLRDAGAGLFRTGV